MTDKEERLVQLAQARAWLEGEAAQSVEDFCRALAGTRAL